MPQPVPLSGSGCALRKLPWRSARRKRTLVAAWLPLASYPVMSLVHCCLGFEAAGKAGDHEECVHAEA
jgi:hypothetical protein